jgi:hypothetical protein
LEFPALSCTGTKPVGVGIVTTVSVRSVLPAVAVTLMYSVEVVLKVLYSVVVKLLVKTLVVARKVLVTSRVDR